VIAVYDVREVEGLGEGDEQLKVGRAELPKLVRFLDLSSVDTFECERTDSMYFLRGDDGSLFGYAVPQYNPAAIPGLSAQVNEAEVWSVEVEDFSRALAALDATRDPSDHALTVHLGDIPEGGDGLAILSVQDVTGQQRCTVNLTVQHESRDVDGVVEVVTHIEWLKLALSRLSKGRVTVGVSLSGAKYLKFHQTDESGCQRAALVGLRGS